MKFLFAIILLCGVLFSSCFTSPSPEKSAIQVHAFRLKPGEDLLNAIQHYVHTKSISAGWVATCVGSLTDYNIRPANSQQLMNGKGHFEIVSLVGTLSADGPHLHLSISDSTGKTIGGHLMQGCKVYTTAELVLQSTGHFIFKRAVDGTTPWDELQVEEAVH